MAFIDVLTRSVGEPSDAEKERYEHTMFLASLSPSQFESFKEVASFVVCDPNGVTWAIMEDGTINCQDRDETYFLRIYNISKWTELAIKKSWMENCPDELLKRAARLDFRKESPNTRGVSSDKSGFLPQSLKYFIEYAWHIKAGELVPPPPVSIKFHEQPDKYQYLISTRIGEPPHDIPFQQTVRVDSLRRSLNERDALLASIAENIVYVYLNYMQGKRHYPSPHLASPDPMGIAASTATSPFGQFRKK